MSQATTPSQTSVDADTHVRLIHVRDERRHGTVHYQFLCSQGSLRAVRRTIADDDGERVLDAPERSHELPPGVRATVVERLGVPDWPTVASDWGDTS